MLTERPNATLSDWVERGLNPEAELGRLTGEDDRTGPWGRTFWADLGLSDLVLQVPGWPRSVEEVTLFVWH